jgi:hypothetical protein
LAKIKDTDVLICSKNIVAKLITLFATGQVDACDYALNNHMQPYIQGQGASALYICARTYSSTASISAGPVAGQLSMTPPLQAARAVPRPQPAAVSEFWYELKQRFFSTKEELYYMITGYINTL